MDWVTIASELTLPMALAIACYFLWKAWRTDRESFDSQMQERNEHLTSVLTGLVQRNMDVISNNTQAMQKLCQEVPEILRVKEEQESIIESLREIRQAVANES